MERADLERRVRQIAWPEPTEELRLRVLSAAPVVEWRVTWSDRVWFSRTWRVAAAAAVVGLIAVDSFSQTRTVARFVPTPQALAEAQAIDATVREIGLPADLAASLARRALASNPQPGAGDQQTRLALAFETEGDRR